MRTLFIAILLLILMSTGCSAENRIVTGTVVDAETGVPIEGAVVLIEWTKAEGLPGLVSTKSYKVVEFVTDKDGKFAVEDVKKLFIDPPDVTVYKKGYVAWSSRWIFPDWRNRTDFKWGTTSRFKLEHFKFEYSYNDHVSFIRSSINSSLNLEAKKKIYDAFESEREIALQERMQKNQPMNK